jgi:hypothetical protein
MFQFILSAKVNSVSHESGKTYFSATHFTPDNKSFSFKGISDAALNIEAGKNYLIINAIPKNYDGDTQVKHLHLEASTAYETGSLMIESNGDSVNSLCMTGRTTADSTKTSGIRSERTWNLTKFNLIVEANIYDKNLARRDSDKLGAYPTFSLKCDYWNNFPVMPSGNQYVIRGELVSAVSLDNKEYFNVKVQKIEFGAESKANAAARQVA